MFKSNGIQKISTLAGFTAGVNYGMTTSALADLRKVTRFKQMKFKCRTSGNGGRYLNIKTRKNLAGTAVVEYFCNTTAAFPASCGSYVASAGDNSIIGGNCASWGTWKTFNNDEKLFDHPMYIHGSAHWNILPNINRFECDDPARAGVIGKGDYWTVHVR